MSASGHAPWFAAPDDALSYLIALGLDRCPPGCAKCAAEYLDAKEHDEAANSQSVSET